MTPQREQVPAELELRLGQMSDRGPARPLNEDYTDCYVPTPADEVQRRTKGAIFLVADGMGGHQAGEVASRQAVEWVMQEYYADTAHKPGDSLVRAFKVANQALYDYAWSDPTKVGMGTTLVAAVILGRKVYVANVGDSRAYLIKEQGITRITEDHSWVEEQVRARLLTRQQAERHPQRNLITRALGSKPAVEVDLFEGELHEGDVLLLCTDGLSGPLSERQIAQIARSLPPPQAAAGLVAQANARGGEDNVSVLIVEAVAPPERLRDSAEDDGGSLAGRQVRVFGYQQGEGGVVTARFIERGSRWWAWWQKPWTLVYQVHPWDREVWVYGIVDRSPNGLLVMDDSLAVQRADRVVLRGTWKVGERSTIFSESQIYRLEGNRYVPLTWEPIPMPQPTVTLMPTP